MAGIRSPRSGRTAFLVGLLVAPPVSALLATPAGADRAGPLFELVDAAAQRLEIAEPVAAFKWRTHGAIEDPVRVEQEVAELRDRANDEHIDPDYVAQVFGDQISATEAIEYSRFADWKLTVDTPGPGPVAPPDLAASRAAIDALNNKILSHIAANWSLLQAPECARQLQNAREATIRARRLDHLYQRALSTATRSYCTTLPDA